MSHQRWRSRKATGNAHATDAVVNPDAFRWTSGGEDVSRFDLPTARSFASAFCRACGSPMPHASRSGHDVVGPCGALDDAPGERPSMARPLRVEAV